MSIYQKLAQARVKLQQNGLKKSGRNQKFSYFELSDFLPAANAIFAELNLCPVVTYDHDFAKLTLYNGEKADEQIVFTSPMVQKALPSGTDIQNLGAIQTYQRRYLYLTALEIAESDAVDAVDTQKEKPQNWQKPANASPKANKSTPTFAERVEQSFAQCQTKEELEAAYDKWTAWVAEKAPAHQDELDLIYNDKLLNFM